MPLIIILLISFVDSSPFRTISASMPFAQEFALSFRAQFKNIALPHPNINTHTDRAKNVQTFATFASQPTLMANLPVQRGAPLNYR